MKILTLNVGSSSIKYALFENSKQICKAKIDRILVKKGLTYEKALALMFNDLVKRGNIKKIEDIKAIAHRVVHGGKLQKHCRLTKGIIKKVQAAKELAPLHDTPGLLGISYCTKRINCPQFAILDTAFHAAIPEKASTYGIPLTLQKKYAIKRYGFHGISHEYLVEQVKQINPKAKRIVTCHLGNGSSITAIKDGKSVDTSMGMTPLEGPLMGTRSGSIDPGILLFLLHHEKYSISGLGHLLNKESGMKGFCGSSDIRDVLKKKSKASTLAIEVFCYQVAKYIASYTAALGGLDALVFTAGIGEHHPSIRIKICGYLTHLGVLLDKNKNRVNNKIISAPSSTVSTYVIPTNEELMMVKHTLKLLK